MSSSGYSDNKHEIRNRHSNTYQCKAGSGAATPVAVPILHLR